MSSYGFQDMSDSEYERARFHSNLGDDLRALDHLGVAMDAYNAHQKQNIVRDINRNEFKKHQREIEQNVASMTYRDAMAQSNQANGITERHGDEFSLAQIFNERLWIVSYLREPDAYYVVFAADPQTKHLAQAFETVEGAHSAAQADEHIQSQWAEIPDVSEWPEHEQREYQEWSESVRLNPQTDQNEDM